MAIQTPLSLRNQIIYSIFARNYAEAGTFKVIQKDLPRIKALGTDIIWFLPFYPIGEEKRKGSIGSPYAIKDYRAIDPTHGSIDDFKNFVDACHQNGIKVMIDIVYSHTSPDSFLVQNHPEWFYRKENGDFGNRVGDWSDIVDLNYRQAGLWEYQINTLCQWAEIVDGFRCDVAPLVPLDFWQTARVAVNKVNPDLIWLAETVEPHFIRDLRANGHLALSDSEIYQVFDLTYDYDIKDWFDGYLRGEKTLTDFIERILTQDYIYPANYVKMHHLENHDQERFASIVTDVVDRYHWHAFIYFIKGAVLLFNGQEYGDDHTMSLFEPEQLQIPANSQQYDQLVKLAKLMKQYIPIQNVPYHIEADNDNHTALIQYQIADRLVIAGVCFNRKASKNHRIQTHLPDGEYINLINGDTETIHEGQLIVGDDPILMIINNF